MNQAESSFLKNTVPAAIRTQGEFGVPASVTLAQAILESGWGKSSLATLANNFFGIKAAAHADPSTYKEFPTSEFVDGRRIAAVANFARYPSPVESFEAHARLLALNPRYAPAMAAKQYPAMFAAALQDCGYSTNPNYAQDLMRLVTEFDLAQYDSQPAPPAAPAKGV